MPQPPEFILGEFHRTLDERFRLSVPGELLAPLTLEGEDCILAKERPGCLSLWNATRWQARLDQDVELVKSKMRAGRLDGQLEQVQLLGRLLSTRHARVQLAARGRLLLPEGFREFLRVEAGGNAVLIGAGVCLEIWHPQAWLTYLEQRMPEFRQLLEKLSG
jgi:MraZ protein